MPNDIDLDSTLIEQALASQPGPCRIHVGFSGGLDSTVLLHLVWHWWLAQPEPRSVLRAIYVDHQLSPESSRWAEHCVRLCRQWGIDCISRNVTVDRSRSSLEQQARQARYEVFRDELQPGDVLLLAHHRDDQVETLLQRLARGSGPLGLASMTPTSHRHGFPILRPLLELDREQLEQYARHHGLSWVEDPSNQDESLERNFIRRQLLPLWRSQRPQINQTLARSARLCGESADLLDQLAELDSGGSSPDGGLAVAQLLPLNRARRNNLLRYWLRRQGVQPPSEVLLGRIIDEVAEAAADAQPQVEWGSNSVRRFQARLYVVDHPFPQPPQPGDHPIPLESLQAAPCLPLGCWLPDGGAVAFSRQALSDRGLSDRALTIDFRRGGERLRLPGRPAKPLKDLFQEAGVPPWLRGLWPILYCGEDIAGLPGLWVCDGFQPIEESDRISFSWDRGKSAQD